MSRYKSMQTAYNPQKKKERANMETGYKHTDRHSLQRRYAHRRV